MEALKYCHMPLLTSVFGCYTTKILTYRLVFTTCLLNIHVLISTKITINKIFSFHLGEPQRYPSIPVLFFTALLQTNFEQLLFIECQKIEDHIDNETVPNTWVSKNKVKGTIYM